MVRSNNTDHWQDTNGIDLLLKPGNFFVRVWLFCRTPGSSYNTPRPMDLFCRKRSPIHNPVFCWIVGGCFPISGFQREPYGIGLIRHNVFLVPPSVPFHMVFARSNFGIGCQSLDDHMIPIQNLSGNCAGCRQRAGDLNLLS